MFPFFKSTSHAEAWHSFSSCCPTLRGHCNQCSDRRRDESETLTSPAGRTQVNWICRPSQSPLVSLTPSIVRLSLHPSIQSLLHAQLFRVSRLHFLHTFPLLLLASTAPDSILVGPCLLSSDSNQHSVRPSDRPLLNRTKKRKQRLQSIKGIASPKQETESASFDSSVSCN